MKKKVKKMNREEALIIAERAEQWLERIKRNDYDRAEFLGWLKESPTHARELLNATAWDRILEHTLDPERKVNIDDLQVHAATNVVPLSSVNRHIAAAAALVRPRNMMDRRIRWPWLASLGAAACLAVALALGWPQISAKFAPQAQFTTAIGEQRSLGLPDGSVINLNTRSRVRVAFSATARDVYLLEGQAIFKVKHDAVRPFRVHVDSAVVQAIGTQFDVYRLKDRTSVAVIEGVVQIIPSESNLDSATLSKLPPDTRILTGETVAIVADGQLTSRAKITPQDAGAWQQRRLVFHKHTLAEIAMEFNRYNRTPRIRVDGEELLYRRFSGVFDADDPESLVMALSLTAGNPFAFDRRGDELVIRLRSSLAQSSKGE